MINDAHLYLGGVGTGEDSFFDVDETFLTSDESMSVHRTTLGGGEEQVLSDWVDLETPRAKLIVTKDIVAIASANSNQSARATVIDQSFSQLAPEPSSVALAAFSCLSLIAFRRRRSHRRVGSQ